VDVSWVAGLLLTRPTGILTGVPGAVRPTGQPRGLAQRNEASIRLGALLNTVQGYSATQHTHSGLRNGPNKWPWRCGLIANPVSGVEWSGLISPRNGLGVFFKEGH